MIMSIFADTVANKQIVVKSGGHINSESGFDKFEAILEEIL
jgi:predicted alpha/beta hydrolase family esterase